MRLIQLFEQKNTAATLDQDELEDLLSAVEYELEEVNSASMDAEGDEFKKLERDYRALMAVETVVRNNLRALAKPELLANSIFLYDYQEGVGASFSVAAVQIWIEQGVAHVKWLGSLGKSGRALLDTALKMAKLKGATSSKVEAKWESEGFYQKMGYEVTHRGEYNPFTDSSLVSMRKDLEEKWSTKYKRSINCAHPRGFSQRAHCAARKLRQKGRKTRSKPVV